MTRFSSLAFVLALLGASSACMPGWVDANSNSPVILGAVDPSLVQKAKTLVFSFSNTQTCADLVDLSPAQIGALLEGADENAPLQILEPSTEEHVFGKVDPNIPIAYFVLASVKTDFGQRVAFEDLSGTVFAMGCRDFAAPSGTRHDLPLTLFPVGLR
jgi:hypothetical protein